MQEAHYYREGNWREDFELAWEDYMWGDFDRSDAEEEKARDTFFKLIMKARDIQLISVGRKPRNPDTLGWEAEGCPNCGTKPGENCGCAGYEATGGD